MHRFSFSLALIFVGAFSANASSLKEAVAVALAHSPDIAAAQARVREAEADVRAARRYENPEIEAEYARETHDDVNEWEVGGRLPIDVSGQVRHRTAAAMAKLKASRREFDDARRKVSAHAAHSYLAVGLARERLRLADETLDVRERLVVIASERLRVEDIPRLEYELAVAERESERAERSKAVEDLKRAEARLAGALFLPPGESFPVGRDLWVDAPTEDLSVLVQRAHSRRGDIASLSYQAESESSSALALYASRWNGTSVGLRYSEEGSDRDREKTVGVGITIPIPILNDRAGERDAAYARADALVHERDRRRRDIATEIEAERESLRQADHRLELMRSTVLPLAEKNVGLVEEAYVYGRMRAFEVIQAEERYLNALSNYVSAYEVRVEAAASLVEETSDSWIAREAFLPVYRHVDAPAPREPMVEEAADTVEATAVDSVPTASTRRTYTVRPGDSLFSIARNELGVQERWKEIAEMNRLTAPYSLKAGQTLYLRENISR